VFKDAKSANTYAQTLHQDQAKYGNASSGQIAVQTPDPASQGGKSDEPRERKIYQHGQLHGTIKLTDAEAKQLADDADFKAQGGTIK
jgi:hypothetical protein